MRTFEGEHSATTFIVVDQWRPAVPQPQNLQRWLHTKPTPRASVPFLCPSMRKGAGRTRDLKAQCAEERHAHVSPLLCSVDLPKFTLSLWEGASWVAPASLGRVRSAEVHDGEQSPLFSPTARLGQSFCSTEPPPVLQSAKC